MPRTVLFLAISMLTANSEFGTILMAYCVRVWKANSQHWFSLELKNLPDIISMNIDHEVIIGFIIKEKL